MGGLKLEIGFSGPMVIISAHVTLPARRMHHCQNRCQNPRSPSTALPFVKLILPSSDDNGSAEGGGHLFHYLFAVLNNELHQRGAVWTADD